MTWFVLIIAGLFEVCWAIGLKYSEGFTRLYPSIFTLVTMAISFYLLSIAMRSLPVGTAYSIWVGIGAVGAVIVGAVAFNESLNPIRVISVGLIIAGIIGLKLTSS
ncbi:quaternary ammonium compound efflux SMR transporter SugE [Pseudomonas sp. F1_0610]|uniref:quaternary ammonium compound efflux SMR transporter SugE n=1 Tax=Pseudomonas sp. F1_0610 TaxID=3114284 RepID=UPI0039C05804